MRRMENFAAEVQPSPMSALTPRTVSRLPGPYQASGIHGIRIIPPCSGTTRSGSVSTGPSGANLRSVRGLPRNFQASRSRRSLPRWPTRRRRGSCDSAALHLALELLFFSGLQHRPQPLAVTDRDCDRSLIDLTDSSRAAGQGEQFKVHLLVIDRAVEIAGGEGALCRERQAKQRNRQ